MEKLKYKFLNSEFLKGRLIKLCLFLASYEMMKENLEDEIKKFFCHEFDNENNYIENEEYKRQIYAKYNDGKEIKNKFDGTLQWYLNSKAMNNDELIEIKKLRKFRNSIAHYTLEMIMDEKEYFLEEKIQMCKNHVEKNQKWWYQEIYSNSNETDISYKSGVVLAMTMLQNISYE